MGWEYGVSLSAASCNVNLTSGAGFLYTGTLNEKSNFSSSRFNIEDDEEDPS
jgi:hypothetical protein